MMHLVHHALSAPHLHHTLGRCFEVHTRMCFEVLALTNDLQAFSIHLETLEDVLVSPHPLGVIAPFTTLSIYDALFMA